MDLFDILALAVFTLGLVLSVHTMARFFYYREQLKETTRQALALRLSQQEREEVIEVDAIYASFADVAVDVQDAAGVAVPVQFRLCLN